MVLLAITVVEIMAPGAGSSRGSVVGLRRRPGRAHSERWTYFFGTQLIPVVVFVLIGVAFWASGTKTPARGRRGRPSPPQAVDAASEVTALGSHRA